MLIHKGVKLPVAVDGSGISLRALLIHKGVKPEVHDKLLPDRLRALLIHKGVKPQFSYKQGYRRFESFVNS